MEIRRRGIIFALDAALAVTVVIIILINSSYYFSTSSKESLSQLQPVRIGSDVIALLDFGGNIEFAIKEDDKETDPNIPSKNLNVSDYLPQNYAMRFGITDMKETVINEDNCEDSPEFFCLINAGVDCNNNGCILKTNDWIKVLPAVISGGGYIHNIKNQGYHFVSIGTTTLTKDSMAIRIEVNNNEPDANKTDSVVTFDKDTGIFFWGNANLFPYFEAGNSPYNWIKITNLETTPVTLKWVRVVGDESYMRYGGETTIPIDRFVGSGERFVTASDTNNFLGYYLVRYWVWLKTTGG